MATKTIVRWKPPSELYGRRELLPETLESVGIFTQKKPLLWDKEKGFWLDVEEAGVSDALLELLQTPEFSNDDLGHFIVEQQEVPDEEEEKAEEPKNPELEPVAPTTPAPRAAVPPRKVKDNPQA